MYNGIQYTEFFTWGSDQYGQLGINDQQCEDSELSLHQQLCHQTPRTLSFDTLIRQVACGDFHTVFITQQTQIFSMGRNNVGQLGVGDTLLQISQQPLLVSGIDGVPKMVQCGSNHTVCLTKSGRLYTWGQGAIAQGSNSTSYCPKEPQFEVIQNPIAEKISCGKSSTAFVTNKGQVFVTGNNHHGQFGKLPSVLKEFRILQFHEQVSDVACGQNHLLLLTQKCGKVYALGDGSKGNLGEFDKQSDVPVQIDHLTNIQSVHAGRHSAAFDTQGKLFLWGPVFAQKQDFFEPVVVKIGTNASKISIGQKHSAVVDSAGVIFTWGLENTKGQLGGNHGVPTVLESLSDRQAVEVACGLDFCVGFGQDYDLTTRTMGIQDYYQKSKQVVGQPQIINQSFPSDLQSKLHERIAQLSEQNRNLVDQNNILTEKVDILQDDKAHLIQMCEKEVQDMASRVEKFIQNEQQIRKELLSQAEMKIIKERSLNLELSETIKYLKHRLRMFGECKENILSDKTVQDVLATKQSMIQYRNMLDNKMQMFQNKF